MRHFCTDSAAASVAGAICIAGRRWQSGAATRDPQSWHSAPPPPPPDTSASEAVRRTPAHSGGRRSRNDSHRPSASFSPGGHPSRRQDADPPRASPSGSAKSIFRHAFPDSVRSLAAPARPPRRSGGRQSSDIVFGSNRSAHHHGQPQGTRGGAGRGGAAWSGLQEVLAAIAASRATGAALPDAPHPAAPVPAPDDSAALATVSPEVRDDLVKYQRAYDVWAEANPRVVESRAQLARTQQQMRTILEHQRAMSRQTLQEMLTWMRWFMLPMMSLLLLSVMMEACSFRRQVNEVSFVNYDDVLREKRTKAARLAHGQTAAQQLKQINPKWNATGEKGRKKGGRGGGGSASGEPPGGGVKIE